MSTTPTRDTVAVLDATRRRVVKSLAAHDVGDFVVDVAPAAHRVTVQVEAAGPVDGALDAVRHVTPGADADAEAPAVDIVTGQDITVAPLGASPTAFPPYEAGLHVDVTSSSSVIRCTAGYGFTRGGEVLGGTAGHCGDVGAAVTAGATPVGTVTDNGYYAGQQVEADVALHTLPAGVGAASRLHNGDLGHRRVAGAVAPGAVTEGTTLCFAGRISGGDRCGPVTAVDRTTCCDAGGRSFVFTCIDRSARAGDSGAPVYAPVGDTGARAAGLLSSSVTIDGTDSMCFTPLDAIERLTGATIVTPAG